MKKEKYNEKYNDIFIISYVGEYALQHVRLVIDFDALECFDESIAKDFRREINNCFDQRENTYISDLYCIHGTNERLKEIAFANSEHLIKLLDRGIGADDGHFDYYPDLVDQFRQLCVKINEIELYNETIKKIKAHKEYSDEDEEVEFEEL